LDLYRCAVGVCSYLEGLVVGALVLSHYVDVDIAVVSVQPSTWLAYTDDGFNVDVSVWNKGWETEFFNV